MMTKQEVFDKVLAHLRKQGREALSDSGMCVYRAPDGTKCAAGCLILDEHYSRCFEGRPAFSDIVVKALRKSGVPEEADELVSALQKLHDYLHTNLWEVEFVAIAGHHGLAYAAP